MCTAIAICNKEFYFGRNMDIEGRFGEHIVTVPRRYPFFFRRAGDMICHYAMVGTAAVVEGYPLFADAMNEKGLCMAGLSFPGNAVYGEVREDDVFQISPFELIPWVLGRCSSVGEARQLLEKTRVVSIAFSENLDLTPLHWCVADKSGSLVIEPTEQGLMLYEDPVGVLTNNPTFPAHLADVDAYGNLSPCSPGARISEEAGYFSLGLGGVGLPGDYSSRSRFVRAAFLKKHLQEETEREGRIAQVFQLLTTVAPPRGVVLDDNGLAHYTTYSCCMCGDDLTYYHRATERLCPLAVVLDETTMEGDMLKAVKLEGG